MKANLEKIAEERFGAEPSKEKSAFKDSARRQIDAMERTTYWSIMGSGFGKFADTWMTRLAMLVSI